MGGTPKRIEVLAELLTMLPGIGPRQALRLAFHIAELPKKQLADFTTSFSSMQEMKRCDRCFIIHEGVDAVCSLCLDSRRNPALVALVEKDTDRITLEHTKQFSGLYLITGRLSKDGILSETTTARLRQLQERFPKDAPADEFILAFSPTTLGDVNASVVTHLLQGHAKKITRLGRGIPTGGEIEFADDETLENALRNRN